MSAVLLLTLLVVTLLLTGCRSGRGDEDQSLTDQERQAAIVAIANRYAESNDVEAAQMALEELGYPNASQSVLALAETYIAAGDDQNTTHNLVMLAQAMGPISRMAQEYVALASNDAGMTSASPTDTAQPTATSTPLPPTDTPEPTATPTDTPEPSATPTETPIPVPKVAADSQGLNVRSGPGTLYPVVGLMRQGDQADILARSSDGNWWQVMFGDGSDGWIFADLVTASGPVESVALAQNIQPPPATPTPAPPPTPPTPTPPPKPAIDFALIKDRMLSKQENGGCSGNHNIYVKVVDINGNPLNGVTVRRVWAGEEVLSGSKPDDFMGRPDQGWLTFALYKNGDQVQVVRDADGREVSSDVTRSLEVEDEKIGAQELMSKGYCSPLEECQRRINDNTLCRYHYSYEIVFQRQY